MSKPVDVTDSNEGYSFIDSVFDGADVIENPPGPDDVDNAPSGDKPGDSEEPKETPTETPKEEPKGTEDEPPKDEPKEEPKDEPKDEPKEEETEELEAEDFIPKEEEKEFPDADEIPALEGDDKAKAKWGELRTELAEAKKEIETLKSNTPSQVKELEEKLSSVEAERDELRSAANVFAIEKTPEYQDRVAKPMNAIMDVAESIAKKNELNPEDLFDVLADSGEAQDKRLAELVTDMSERDKMTLYSLVNDAAAVFRIDAQIKEAAAESGDIFETGVEDQIKARDQAEAKNIKAGIDPVFDKFLEKSPSIGDEEVIKKLREQASGEDYANLTPGHKAYAVVAGTLMPKMITALKARDAEIKSLTEEIKGLKGSEPNLDGDREDTPPGSTPDDELSFYDAIDKGLKDIGQ